MKKKWSAETIIDEIRRIGSHDIKDLSYTRLCKTGNLKLYRAARRCFGSFKDAIICAGFDYRCARLVIDWKDGDKIINDIKQLASQSKLRITDSYLKKNNKLLYSAAINHYGSWSDAVKAAGFDYEEIKLQIVWSEKKIIGTLKEFANDNIFKLSDFFLRNNEKKLYSAILRYFGSLEVAITRAGFDYESIRLKDRWSKEAIKKEIFEIGCGDINNLSYVNFRKKYTKLYYNCLSFFGSFENAINQSGFDYDEIRLCDRWDSDRIMGEIKKIGKNNIIYLSDRSLKDNNPKLFDAARRHFGSLERAVNEAGFNYDEIRNSYLHESLCAGILNEILFVRIFRQYSFDWLRYKNVLYLDFYIPSLKLAVEYNGRQHYEPVSVFGGQDAFELIKKRDKRKKELLEKHNIKLIVIPYWEKLNKKNIRNILIKEGIERSHFSDG